MPDDKALAFLASLAARRRGDAMVLDSSYLILDAMVVADIFDCDILTDLEVANAIVAACREYAARRHDQTHSDECWRLPGHGECAQRRLAQWWPVIEAIQQICAHDAMSEETKERTRDWADTRVRLNHQLEAAVAAALKEGNADG